MSQDIYFKLLFIIILNYILIIFQIYLLQDIYFNIYLF